MDGGEPADKLVAKEGDSDAEDGEIKSPIEVAQGSDSSTDAVFYDKKKSFFDSISCEALERSKGNNNRPDWKAEKKLNKETFGVSGNSRGNFNHRGFNRGRGYSRGQRGWSSGFSTNRGWNHGRFFPRNF